MQQFFGSCCCLVTTLLWVAFFLELGRERRRNRAVPTIGRLPTINADTARRKARLAVPRISLQRSTFIDYVDGVPESRVFAENNEEESPIHQLEDDEMLGYLGPPVQVLLPGEHPPWVLEEKEYLERLATGEPAPHPEPIPELQLHKPPSS